MRADRFKYPLLTAGLALALGAAALGAQDTLAPAQSAVAVPRVSGDRLGFGGTVVSRGETVDGDVVSAVGDVRVEGHVRGDVTVGRGNLLVEPGASIDGDAKVSAGNLSNHGTIRGSARVASGKLVNWGRVLGEMRAEDAPRATMGQPHAAGTTALHVRRSFLGRMGDGLAGLVSTLAFAMVLAAIGAALVFYALPRVEKVGDVVRTSTLRAGAVGLAAAFLAIPVGLALMVALAFSIVGIPLIFLAVPLYMLALAGAGAMGLVAVAHAIGERTAEQRGSFETLHRNAYTYVFTGLGVLLAPLAAAHLLQMTGFLGVLGDILQFFAVMLVWAAAIVGFGAVVMTRAGGWADRLRWRRYDPIFDADPVFDSTPGARAGHV
jgi:hypothetical protein